MLPASTYLHSRHNGVTKKVLPEAYHTLLAPTHEAQVKNSFNFPGADLDAR